MKKYLFGIIITLVAYSVNAQRLVEKELIVKPNTSLNLKLDFADTIHVVQSKDNSLRIKATVSINDNLHNDKYELITEESDQMIRVNAKIHDMNSLRVPCKNLKGSNYNYHDGKCLTMTINYTIEIPAVSNLRVETISGDIIIENSKYPLNIKSISGFIDLSIPVKSNANISIETVTGGVYTNHDTNKENYNCDSNPGGTDANLKLGSGENRIKLNTVSGDIYLRKI